MEPVPVQLVPTCPTKWDYKAVNNLSQFWKNRVRYFSPLLHQSHHPASPRANDGFSPKCSGNVFRITWRNTCSSMFLFLFSCSLKIVPGSPPSHYICGARLPPKNISRQKEKWSKSLQKKRDGRRWCPECGSASGWGATQPPVDGHVDWSHILCRWKWWQRTLFKSWHVLVMNYWCVACIETLQYWCAYTTHKLQTSTLNLVRINTHSWGQRGKWGWIENCLSTT